MMLNVSYKNCIYTEASENIPFGIGLSLSKLSCNNRSNLLHISADKVLQLEHLGLPAHDRSLLPALESLS